jgi:hypothetical protein
MWRIISDSPLSDDPLFNTMGMKFVTAGALTRGTFLRINAIFAAYLKALLANPTN